MSAFAVFCVLKHRILSFGTVKDLQDFKGLFLTLSVSLWSTVLF